MPARVQRVGIFGREPPVGSDVVDTRERLLDRDQQRARDVIDVHDLHGRAGWPQDHGRVTGRGLGEHGARPRADDRRDAQARRHPTVLAVRPLGEHAFALGVEDRREVAGIRPQHRVLGERHRVVLPRAVHRRAREPHHAVDAGPARGLEHPAGPVGIDPSHQCFVRNRPDDGGEVHQRVHVVQVRREIGVQDVDPVKRQLAGAPGRIAHVESDDARHVRRGIEQRQQPLTDESGHPGDRDGALNHSP